jgi:hypothetical protein
MIYEILKMGELGVCARGARFCTYEVSTVSTEQELAQTVVRQAAELESLRSANTKTVVAAAIGSALDATGLAFHPGSREQLSELFSRDTHLHADPVGGVIVTGPALMPLADFVKGRLADPNYSFHVRGGGPAASQTPSQAGALSKAAEVLPGEDLNAATIRFGLAHSPSASGRDPRTDPSQPMGLRAKR